MTQNVTPAPKQGGKKAALAAGAVALALVSGGVGGVVGANVDRTDTPAAVGGDRHGDGQPQAQPPAPAGSVQEVAARVLPSVVSIAVRVGDQGGEGSGVVLDADGTILTNNHVIAGGGRAVGERRPAITVIFHDGSRATAQLRGADPISDIAVIQVKDHPGLKPINVGSSKNLAVGQDVIAIGSPLGLAGTVTTGIISALNRPVSTSRIGDNTSVIDAIQTDAAINPGNSGGALVNARGALIGINTAIATMGGQDSNGNQRATGSIGLGFAIPIDQAMRVADQLRRTGKAEHPSLGVSVGPASTTDPTQSGARVTKIVPNGAAAAAGIPDGAVIHRFGGRKITGADDLVAAVRSFAPGDVVDIEYAAGGKTTTAKVTLKTLSTN
ncbi:trypsin-like serine protease [Gordonia araii NBRC 100433]|nr:trypsin-like serine protease [Gordonia araii NBRC 100433]